MPEFGVYVPCPRNEEWAVCVGVCVSDGQLAKGTFGVSQVLYVMPLCD